MIIPSHVENHMTEILNLIDYKKIREAMVALDWTWATANGVPTIAQMYESAKHLMESAYEDFVTRNENTYISCGGFTVHCYRDDEHVSFRVTFNVIDVDSEWVTRWLLQTS